MQSKIHHVSLPPASKDNHAREHTGKGKQMLESPLNVETAAHIAHASWYLELHLRAVALSEKLYLQNCMEYFTLTLERPALLIIIHFREKKNKFSNILKSIW